MKEEVNLDEIDVLIIGAGASGIAGLRQLKSTTKFKIRCFEVRSNLGGVWNYKSNPGEINLTFTPEGKPIIHETNPSITPIYEGLRTNVPVELMSFKDIPFNPSTPSSSSFPHHNEILDYLKHSVEEEIKELIQFNTNVKRIKYNPNHSSDSASKRWMIEYTNVNQESSSSNDLIIYADFILAANGHNSKPYIPFLKGLSTFPNRITHSLYYRTPKDEIIKKSNIIAVVGLGPSGYDIVRELANLPQKERPKKLYSLSNHPSSIGYDFTDPKSPSWTKNIIQKPGLKSIKNSTLILQDESELNDIDLLIFATGYNYNYDFCYPDDLPWCDHEILNHEFNRRLHNLDSLQIFYFPDPSFAFLVINTSVIPFPLAEHQARAIAARWTNKSNFKLFPFTNEEEESSSVHVLIPPEEYNVENHLLDLIGEGDHHQTGWKSVPDWKFKLRLEGNDRRKDELGY